MDPRVNQEWTSSEVEEARSLVARLSRKDSSYEDSTDKNKKHKDIVDDLHAWFPEKTMQQVTDMYVDLVVEMHMMHWQDGSHGASGSTHVIGTVCDLMNDNFGVSEEEIGAARDTHGVYTMGDLVKDSIGVPEEEVTTMDANGLVFGCPLEEIRTMEMEEALPMVEKNKIKVLENNIVNHQPVVMPHAGRFWTTEEHRLFLHGLRVCGRGNWKNISKYFVTTRTPVQVSSHAQKYFRRLESRASSRRQRYSINDVGLHDANPWAVDDSSAVWQVLAFNGVNHDPRFGLWAPENPFITMNNLAQFLAPFAQFLSPFLYSQQVDRQPSWSEQQMMGSAATPMQGIGKFMPACQQGSAYLPPEQWMDNM